METSLTKESGPKAVATDTPNYTIPQNLWCPLCGRIIWIRPTAVHEITDLICGECASYSYKERI